MSDGGMNSAHRPRRARGGAAPVTEDASPEQRKRRRRRIILWTSVALVAVLAIATLVVGLYLRQLQNTFDDNRSVIDNLELDDQTTYESAEGSINMLLLGSDSRGEDEADYRSSSGEGAERSDTIMFAHIPEDRSGVYIMSIMRDLWIDIPEYGQGRVNTALGAGGIPLVVDTMNELLQTSIDHVAVINFDGFEDLTTALNGVYVDNPQAFSAGNRNPAFYPEGTIRLEGSDALRFVRERKSFDTGDFVRVENQQLVVRAIIDRFLSGDTLTNPGRVLDVVEAFAPYLDVDEGLDAETLVSYALEMRNMRTDDVHFFTMPMGQDTTTTGGAQVILPDEEAMVMLQRSLANENMDGFIEWLEERESEHDSEYPDLFDMPEDEGAHLEEQLESDEQIPQDEWGTEQEQQQLEQEQLQEEQLEQEQQGW